MNFLNMLKEQFSNIQVLIQDRNFKPFIRPIVAVVLVFFLVNLLNNNAKDKVAIIQKRIEAQQAEVDNEREYRTAKSKYQNLLSKLPPASQKNEWMLLQLGSIANRLKIQDDIKYVKGPTSNFGILEISTANISGNLFYSQIGCLVETIENNPQFLRINKITMDKQENALGKIAVKIEVYTAFLEEHKVVGKASGRK